MQTAQARFNGKPARTADLLKALSDGAGRDVAPLLKPWLERTDLPEPAIHVEVQPTDKGCVVKLEVEQKGFTYPFVVSVNLETEKGARLERVEVKATKAMFSFTCDAPLRRLTFNAGHDIPVSRPDFWVPGNVLDDWSATLLVQGTTCEVEAQRTLATMYRDTLADNMTEVLLPLKTDAEVTDAELAASDLVVFGGPAENGLSARLKAEDRLPLEAGSGWFKWQGRTYGRLDDGLLAAFPNPWNPKRLLVLVLANSRIQQWAMTKAIPRGLPGWTVYRGSEVQQKGHARPAQLDLLFGQ